MSHTPASPSIEPEPYTEPHKFSSWREVASWLEGFPAPLVSMDRYGEPVSRGWIFRGLRKASYLLQPKIERVDSRLEWPVLEVLIESEFRSRAHMHVPAHLLPRDSLTWLALMQHWGVATRLLDFTHSPFVALYFAATGVEHDEAYVRVWAIDTAVVASRFDEVASAARRKAVETELKRQGRQPEPQAFALLDADAFMTPRDSMKFQAERAARLINEALEATDTMRGEQTRSGCVCVASPPSFNPRLASQQGVFLINCAEELTLRGSLAKMMGDQQGWCQVADISVGALPEIERRLFQMNIHSQSLFPDMEGLAGLIDQRTRLHWL